MWVLTESQPTCPNVGSLRLSCLPHGGVRDTCCPCHATKGRRLHRPHLQTSGTNFLLAGPCGGHRARPHTAPTPCSRSLSHTGNHHALAPLPQTDRRSPGCGRLNLHQQSIITEHVCTLPGHVLTALYVPHRRVLSQS